MRFLVALLIAVVLFFIAYFGVEFGASFFERRRAKKTEDRALTTPGGQGAFRDIYFFLWSAIFLGGLSLLLPLSIGFRSEVESAADRSQAFHLFFKIAAIPTLLFFLNLYGQRRGYLRWIKELNWPKQK